MDQFEYTKLAASILLPLLLIFGFRTIVELRSEGRPEKPGYVLAVAEPAPDAAPAAEGAKTAEAGGAPAAEGKAGEAAGGDLDKTANAVLALLPKADAEAGKSVFSKCKACHNVEKGKPKAVGPNLWGVIDRPKASFEGFEYSKALQAKGGNWTFADLAHFISNPKGFVPGTKMVFNGLPDPKDVADVIAYLAQQHEPPVELPK